MATFVQRPIMKLVSYRTIFLFLLMAIAWSSGCGPGDPSSRVGILPAAFGKANKLTVIADSSWWASGLADSVDYTFGAPFLILPRPEPLYDLQHFDFKELDYKPARKELRSYLIISHEGLRGSRLDDMMRKDLGDSLLPADKPYSVKMVQNRWATGQVVFYIYGRNADAVYQAIQERGPAMLAKLKIHDLPILESQAYATRENASLTNKVQTWTGAHFRIPGEFVPALEQDSTLWLRKDAGEMILGLLFKKIPYINQEQFSLEGFKSLHDDMTRIVTSQVSEPTRMVADDRELPLFFSAQTLDQQYAMEVRGIWSMQGDFMGGPFISYVIQSPDQQSLILATGFIYGPGKSKREWMQQLEIILRTARFSGI